jgi:hypothetical protein
MTTQEKEMQTECFICAEPLRISAVGWPFIHSLAHVPVC